MKTNRLLLLLPTLLFCMGLSAQVCPGKIVSGVKNSTETMGPFNKKQQKNSSEHKVIDLQIRPSQKSEQLKQRAKAKKSAHKTLAPLRKQQFNKNVPAQLEIKTDPRTGMPTFISGKNGQSNDQISAKKAAAANWLTELAPILCLENPSEELYIQSENQDDLGFYHIKYQQQYQGIDIYGAEIIVHHAPNADIKLNGRSQPTPYIDVNPSVSKENAKQAVEAHLQSLGKLVEMTDEQKLMYDNYDGPFGDLVIYPSEESFGAFKLLWQLTARPNFIERYEYFVDAQSGEIYDYYDNTCSIGAETASATDLNGVSRSFNTYLYQGNYYMYDASRAMYSGPVDGLPMAGDGGIETLDFQNNSINNPTFADISTPNNSWNNPKAVSAHYHSGVCYEYFRQTHNRSSINGQGGDIISFINVAEQGGGNMDNAFWNGQYMFYGNGGNAFFPLAGALDVAGHEMSHGVIQATANLTYQGESGAINESMADVFGVLIDWGDWKLGEDIVKTNVFPSGALRDMQNPHNGGNQFGDVGWQPEHVNEQYNGSQDNGGVHFNSGIPNKAFYLIASQLGKSKSERIYYRALTQYLTKSSQFTDLRVAVIEAAEDLNDISAADVGVIENAFAAVGIGQGSSSPNDYQEDIEENEGEEFILFVDANDNDPNTIYLTNPQASGFTALTQTAPNRKPSVTDDGSAVYFVGTDNNIYEINITGSDPVQTPLTDDGSWDNCAVSKDGTLLAAITTQVDTSIYVFELAQGTGEKFTLYNPTTATGGLTTAGVLYADVLEWAYNGEDIIYDSFNRVSSVTGEDLEYWDMGVITVWNTSSDNYSEGNIEKVFSNLPEGVSTGNPTFSKNSPYIFAFDYFDFENNEVALLGANFETGEVGTIVEQPGLAYASYSSDDSRIVYTAANAQGVNEVRVVTLNSDKISSSASSSSLIDAARWPVWFTQGDRVLTSVDELEITQDLSIYPNPVNEFFQLNVELEEKMLLSVYNLNGQKVIERSMTPGQSREINVASLSSGQYLLQLTGENTQLTGRLIKN